MRISQIINSYSITNGSKTAFTGHSADAKAGNASSGDAFFTISQDTKIRLDAIKLFSRYNALTQNALGNYKGAIKDIAEISKIYKSAMSAIPKYIEQYKNRDEESELDLDPITNELFYYKELPENATVQAQDTDPEEYPIHSVCYDKNSDTYTIMENLNNPEKPQRSIRYSQSQGYVSVTFRDKCAINLLGNILYDHYDFKTNNRGEVKQVFINIGDERVTAVDFKYNEDKSINKVEFKEILDNANKSGSELNFQNGAPESLVYQTQFVFDNQGRVNFIMPSDIKISISPEGKPTKIRARETKTSCIKDIMLDSRSHITSLSSYGVDPSTPAMGIKPDYQGKILHCSYFENGKETKTDIDIGFTKTQN